MWYFRGITFFFVMISLVGIATQGAAKPIPQHRIIEGTMSADNKGKIISLHLNKIISGMTFSLNDQIIESEKISCSSDVFEKKQVFVCTIKIPETLINLKIITVSVSDNYGFKQKIVVREPK